MEVKADLAFLDKTNLSDWYSRMCAEFYLSMHCACVCVFLGNVKGNGRVAFIWNQCEFPQHEALQSKYNQAQTVEHTHIGINCGVLYSVCVCVCVCVCVVRSSKV